jgi:hypothetical protein
MGVTNTMKWMGRSARNRAEVMSHQMKDRAVQMRLDKAADENDRLRTENRSLRDAIDESHGEHERILDLLATHRDETEDDGGSHRGRWFLFLLLLAGGAWAWMKNREGMGDMGGWGGRPTTAGDTLGGGMTSAA